MPYYKIGGEAVFITHEMDGQLYSQFLANKSAAFRIESKISGTKESAEADKIIYDGLLREYSADPIQFRSRYAAICLRDKSARQNIWDVLYDYCDLTSNATLSDTRSPDQSLNHALTGDWYTQPMGKVFCLNFHVRKTWWSSTQLTIPIDCEAVESIDGKLSNLTITLSWGRLCLGQTLQVIPRSAVRCNNQ